MSLAADHSIPGRGHYVHRPRHAIAIRDRCRREKVEVDCVLRADIAAGAKQTDRLRAFLFKHLGVKTQK